MTSKRLYCGILSAALKDVVGYKIFSKERLGLFIIYIFIATRRRLN